MNQHTIKGHNAVVALQEFYAECLRETERTEADLRSQIATLSRKLDDATRATSADK